MSTRVRLVLLCLGLRGVLPGCGTETRPADPCSLPILQEDELDNRPQLLSIESP